MRFEISVSDVLFECVSQRAASLGISRSEFFAMAAKRYLADLDQRAMVDGIDGAIESAGGEDRSTDDALQAAGRRTLRAVTDEW